MTAINIFDVWQKLMSEVNVQQGGQIRPVTDFQNWYNAASFELFREKLVQAEINQRIDDDLSPFLKSVNIVVSQQTGQPWDLVSYPSDYEGFANMKIMRQRDEQSCGANNKLPIIDGSGKCTQVEDSDYAEMVAKFAGANLVEKIVSKIDNQKWSACVDHDTKSPTYDSPKTTQYERGFKIAPKGVSVVVLDYYSTPQSAIFGYTIGAGDIVVYDPIASTQLQWSTAMQNEFLVRLRKKYGLHVQDSAIYQMSDNDKKELV